MNDSLYYDVVVVGAGNAGIPAAIEGAKNGARVLLVEKDTRIGGTLHSSGGHLSAAGTAIQRRHGIEDSVAAHLADIERIAQGTYRDDLMALAVTNAAETVDWLDDNGFHFDPATPRIVYGHEPYTTARSYYGPDAGLSILEVLKPLLDEVIASGAVTLWTDTPAIGLVADAYDDSVVRSVLVLRRGEELTINAKYVVLASGGFANDPELFAELENAPLVSAAHPTSTGDGLVIAREIGAGLQGLEGRYLPAFGGLPHPTTPGRVQWTDRPLLSAQERLPSEIYVDRTGARWVAEDEPSIDVKERALADIADLTFWMVLDSVGLHESKPLVVGWSVEDVQAKANKRAGVFAADTLDELAALTGIDSSGLIAAVARYNDFVIDGADADFGRKHLPTPIATPPFYALENHGIALITFVGLDCDGHLRIRREDGTSFTNLYGVGEVIGSRAVHGFAYLSGMTVTTAITFGRLIGSELGERVSRAS
jgi:FAD binding domain